MPWTGSQKACLPFSQCDLSGLSLLHTVVGREGDRDTYGKGLAVIPIDGPLSLWALPLTSSVASGKSLHLSQPQSLYPVPAGKPSPDVAFLGKLFPTPTPTSAPPRTKLS